MIYLGDYPVDGLIDFKWSSNGADGASITRSTNGTISVYKANSTTQSTTGVTDTEDFDSVTGIHHCRIDLSADGTFYSAGSDFAVVLSGSTIDTKTVNAVLAHFSIQNRYAAGAWDGVRADHTTSGTFGATTEWVNSDPPLGAADIRDAVGMATNDLDAQLALLPLAADMATAEELATEFLTTLQAMVVDGTLTWEQMQRIVLAYTGGKTTGADTTAPKFYGQDGTTVRISATLDVNNNRTAVALDGSP